MSLYFAYGSNMDSSRIVERVGKLDTVGRAVANHYAHRFDKLGDDGTGKGTIIPAPSFVVYGVLYRVTAEQLAALDDYERGYVRLSIPVITKDERQTDAITYVARVRFSWLTPSDDYFSHYQRGMAEHVFPPDYIATLTAQAKGQL